MNDWPKKRDPTTERPGKDRTGYGRRRTVSLRWS